MSITAFRLASPCGEMAASIFCSSAQVCLPSSRKRENFTASAGTNAGMLASFAGSARIFSSPLRVAFRRGEVQHHRGTVQLFAHGEAGGLHAAQPGRAEHFRGGELGTIADGGLSSPPVSAGVSR
jgi:hypothetical protein